MILQILIFLFLCSCFCGCASTNKDETLIRAVREASNAAIAAHDTAGLGAALTLDYNVITSRNAASAERSVVLRRLAADWSAKPDLFYIRTPGSIEVFAEWSMASETGTWVGTWTEANGDKIELSGSYYAKWHNVAGQWLIRAEIFTPLSCSGGSYCSQGPLHD